MELLARCACFKCSLSSDKGSYETYSKERKQFQREARAASAASNCQQEQQQEQQQQPTPSEEQDDQSNREVGGSSRLKEEEERFAQSRGSNEGGSEISMRPSTSTTQKSATQAKTSRAKGKTKQQAARRTNDNQNNEPDGPRLTSFTLDGVAELITEQRINKSSVIVLVGAGMSTAAGVPDFRSPQTGIYANLQKYNLPHPEDVFKIDYFKNNPAPFYDLSRSILPARLFPTIAHYFIRLLHDKGYLLRCFSQNVDCLESLSGLPKDRLCLAHGSFETGHCLRCNAEYGLAWMRSVVEAGGIPHCIKTRDCKGLIKPDVKLFGERLDGRFFRLVKEDFPKCELLIIIGSSLTVMPFAQLVQKVPAKCPRLLINKTKSGHDLPRLLRIFKPSDGLMYDRKGNTRDVAHIGDCDDACLQLATLLGWNGELIELARERREQLEREQSPSS